MRTILNIRGTSGSGKSMVVRGLMARHTLVQPLGDSKKPDGYECAENDRISLFVVGNYESDCGGCDRIRTPEEIAERVRKYAKLGDVVFEGLLITRTFARYQDLNRELKDHRYIWAFLNTPLETCIQRVKIRRESKGNFKPFNPKNTEDTWNRNRRAYQKAKAAGLDARWLSWDASIENAWAWLNGWVTE